MHPGRGPVIYPYALTLCETGYYCPPDQLPQIPDVVFLWRYFLAPPGRPPAGAHHPICRIVPGVKNVHFKRKRQKVHT